MAKKEKGGGEQHDKNNEQTEEDAKKKDGQENLYQLRVQQWRRNAHGRMGPQYVARFAYHKFQLPRGAHMR
jgi:hypothetical protein